MLAGGTNGNFRCLNEWAYFRVKSDLSARLLLFLAWHLYSFTSSGRNSDASFEALWAVFRPHVLDGQGTQA